MVLLAVVLGACGDGDRASDDADQASGDGAVAETDPTGAQTGGEGIPVDGGVILIYHHVDDETPEATSVTPERFREHLDHLADNDFTVWPLPRLIEAARTGRSIPERTVSITFDDAYQSVYDEVFPLMQARDWPFTVFVPTDPIGSLSIYLDWDELREMEAAGVTMANHTVSHPHMARARRGESEDEWLARIQAEITAAQATLEEELESPARIFAWPYGESSPPVERLLTELDFVGVGQQSGAVAHYSHDFAALPRFPMATGFDDLDSFALKTRTRPLPVTATEPEGGVLEPDAERPVVELSLDDGAFRPGSIACYARGKPIAVEIVEQDPVVARVRATEALPVGRTTYNCTAPAQDGDYWYWYSFLWMKPREDGRWYTW